MKVDVPNVITYLDGKPNIWYGVWCGVDLRMNIKKHVLKRAWTPCSKFVNHPRFDSQHNWRSLHHRFMAMTLLNIKNHYSNIGDPKIP